MEELRARVKELENALELAHSLNSASEHPLLGPNRFTVPNSLDGSTVTHDVEEPMGPEYDALIIAANGRSQYVNNNYFEIDSYTSHDKMAWFCEFKRFMI